MASKTGRWVGRRMLIVHNPVAGWRRRGIAAALAALSACGIAPEVAETGRRGDAETLARSAGPEVEAVVAAGGDGTINEVVNGLMARPLGPLPLGILPLGTANVLAAELGLPGDPAAAARTLAEGIVQRIGLGRVNQRYFAMMAGAGFDARVVAGLDPRLKRRLGRAAYGVEMLRQLAALPRHRYRVIVDGAAWDAAAVVVANGHYYGGRYQLAPAARLTAPSLEVCLFLSGGRRAALRYLAALGLGRLHHLADYRVVTASHVTVEATAPGRSEPVQGDGDIVAALPATLTVAPAVLPVLMPAAVAGSLAAELLTGAA